MSQEDQVIISIYGRTSATTKDISGLTAGVYSCIVRDQNGCILTPEPSFTLTEPLPLVITSSTTSFSTDGAYNINCNGEQYRMD